MTTCFTESGLGPCLSGSRIKKKGGGGIFAKCDISSGLWGTLETEDRRVQPLYTLSTLMGFSHPRVISEWPFAIIMAREGLS